MCRQKNCHGGVIFSDTSDVEINTCTFVNNFIVGIDKYSFDGALGSFVSNIVINLSFFINNMHSFIKKVYMEVQYTLDTVML